MKMTAFLTEVKLHAPDRNGVCTVEMKIEAVGSHEDYEKLSAYLSGNMSIYLNDGIPVIYIKEDKG